MSRNKNRSETLRVYVSSAEKDKIEDNAEQYDLSISSYCRKVLLNHNGGIYE